VIDAYGSTCSLCGEHNPEFLCMDHIGGGGGVERHQLGFDINAFGFYRYLRSLEYPKDRYRLLCFNCNLVATNTSNFPQYHIKEV
jgi:hypothetical protein